MSKNFLQKVLAGEAFYFEIDDYVKKWHESDSDLEIYDFLGLTLNEYELWVEQPNAIKFIVNARLKGANFIDLCQLNLSAARSGDELELNQWLKETGRIKDE